MVLHRHVRKREQSSFLLQAQRFSFCHHAIVSVIYGPSIGMPGWQANLSPASRLPRARHARSRSHHIVPASNLPATVKIWYPIPFLPFVPLFPQANACTAGKSGLKMKLKQAASEAVRQPDCFNRLSTNNYLGMYSAPCTFCTWHRGTRSPGRGGGPTQQTDSPFSLHETGQR